MKKNLLMVLTVVFFVGGAGGCLSPQTTEELETARTRISQLQEQLKASPQDEILTADLKAKLDEAQKVLSQVKGKAITERVESGAQIGAKILDFASPFLSVIPFAAPIIPALGVALTLLGRLGGKTSGQ